jgi:hypothetical protein
MDMRAKSLIDSGEETTESDGEKDAAAMLTLLSTDSKHASVMPPPQAQYSDPLFPIGPEPDHHHSSQRSTQQPGMPDIYVMISTATEPMELTDG